MLNHDDQLLVESELLNGGAGSTSSSSMDSESESELPRRRTGSASWRDARVSSSSSNEGAPGARRLSGGSGGAHAPSSNRPVPTTIYCAPPRQDDEVGSGGRENLNFRRRLLGEGEQSDSESERGTGSSASVFPTAFLQQPLLRKPREALFGPASDLDSSSWGSTWGGRRLEGAAAAFESSTRGHGRRLEGGSGPFQDPWWIPNLWLGAHSSEHHESTQASVAFLSYAYGDYLWYRLYSRLILTFFAIELILKIILAGPVEFYW